MFNDEGEKIGYRYTVSYEGHIFEGDSDGYNSHGYDRWDDAQSLIYAYGDVIRVDDNYYGCTWEKGEWY